MVEITKFDSLQQWLDTRPTEDSRIIAARAALRGLPGLSSLLQAEDLEDPSAIILPIFRANAVASTVGKWPVQQQGLEQAANSAFSAANSAFSAANSADSAARSANSAAAAALSAAADSAAAAARSTAAAALSAARSAYSAAYSAAFSADSAYSAAWKAVEQDANRLEAGMAHGDLADQLLWPEGPPQGLAEAWPTLREALLSEDPLWHVWTDWYQDRLDGIPMIEALEVEKALIPDEDWDKGPPHVNAIIAEMIARHRPQKTSQTPQSDVIDLDALLASRDLRAALADFELDDYKRLIRMVPFVNDIKSLDDPALAQDRANMLSELADLMGDLGRDCQKQLSKNAPDYVRLAANRYQREAKSDVSKVRPGRLWDVGLELAGALKDIEVESSFPDHLFNRLDHAVAKHRDLMREYFAGALARLRPLDRIEPEPDATREDALAALKQSVEGFDSEDWGDAPAPDPEIAAEMADRVEELGDILTRIEQTTDPAKARDLDQTFWRKAKAAMLTVRRYGLKTALFAGWSVSTAAGLASLFPAEFATALQLIQRILGSASWL